MGYKNPGVMVKIIQNMEFRRQECQGFKIFMVVIKETHYDCWIKKKKTVSFHGGPKIRGCTSKQKNHFKCAEDWLICSHCSAAKCIVEIITKLVVVFLCIETVHGYCNPPNSLFTEHLPREPLLWGICLSLQVRQPRKLFFISYN